MRGGRLGTRRGLEDMEEELEVGHREGVREVGVRVV